jgi:predicted transcriptional regulator
MIDHEDMRDAREKLGLSIRQMAIFLKTDAQSVRRMEMSPSYSTSRQASPRIEAIIREVLDR